MMINHSRDPSKYNDSNRKDFSSIMERSPSKRPTHNLQTSKSEYINYKKEKNWSVNLKSN